MSRHNVIGGEGQMGIFKKILKLGIVLLLLGIGSCSLHSGFHPRGFGSGEDSIAVGFGVIVLASTFFLFRKWYRTPPTEHGIAPRPGNSSSAYHFTETVDAPPSVFEPRVLAEYPVYLWAGRNEPFDAWRTGGTEVPTNLESIFHIASDAYLFFLWHVKIVNEYGPAVASRVRAEQISRMDEIGNEFGKQLFNIVDQIQDGVVASSENPVTATDRPDVEVPHLYRIAVTILATWHESPYFVEHNFRQSYLPNMYGHDFALARLLMHCDEAGNENFTRTINAIKIDARALAAWVQRAGRG